MSPLLTYLQAHAQAPLGHVYIVGAGDGSQLPQWRSLNAQQLWLAEAHPALSTRLLARTQAHENETVTQAAITGQAEAHATLHLLSLPGKSSLSAPTHLNRYFPNVQEQGSQQVAAQALSAWATHAGEDTHHEHLLVIDSPGQAHQLISDTPANILQQFAWVQITAAEEALYEQDAPLSEIDALLQQRGYTCSEEDADTHYPFIARLYQRQPSVVERLALEATINALRKEITQAQTDTEEANKATAAAQSEAEKLANELEQARANAKQREEACATAKSETKKLAKELEEARNTAKQHEEACVIARSEATKQSQALKDAEAARATAKSEAEKLAKELEEARVIARSEATKQSQALEAAQKQLEETEQARATAKSETEKLAKELEEARVIARSEATKQSQALEAAQKQLAERDQQLEEARNTAKQHEEACVIARSEATKQSQALEATQSQLAERDQQLEEARNTAKQHEEASVIARRETTKQSQALKDTETALATAKSEAEKLAKELEESRVIAKSEATKQSQALEAAQKQLEETEQARASAKSETEKLAKELEESRVIARSEATKQSQALEAAKQQIETLTQQLAAKENSLHNTEERFSSLESKLDQLFGEQRSYIQQTTNALGQHVTRSAQQQRDEQALTHYLHHGQRPISTELPPNFAMALLERRETQRYDVMVVLGSTPITELLAQAVVNETRQQPRLTAQHANESGKDVQHYVTPSQDDLPQAVISVAHKKSLCKTLKQRLAANHTQEAVNVVYAPWVEANEKGDLFYAWEATLKRLNQWLEEDAKVLVVIGNALAEANHHRMAALPQLLQHLPTQTLEVIVEGNHYPQESDLKAEWEALLSKRQREAETLQLPTALGLRVAG